MDAAILAIGDELTLGQNLDTNSPWIATHLAQRSILTIEQRTVADDRHAISRSILELSNIAELIIITGGLGPTDDDLTREALQDVFDPSGQAHVDEHVLQEIAQRFEWRGIPMPAMNRKQATRPQGMRCLPNPHGTAPGLAGKFGRCWIFALPGPPREMQPMFMKHVRPELEAYASGDMILTSAVHQHGLGESDAAQRLGDLMERMRNPLVGITVSDSLVSARIRGVGPEKSIRSQVEATAAQIEQLWHPYAYGRDGQTLAKAAGDLLRQSQVTLVTAESCTGGWLGKAIVDVAGSSDYYLGGWVTYSNAMKHAELGLAEDVLATHGAVSEAVARRMAEGALRAGYAQASLAITGVAGPEREESPSAKPAGTVFVALSRQREANMETIVRRFLFPGDRTTVRDRSVKAALQMLRFALLGVSSQTPLLWEDHLSASAKPNRQPGSLVR